MKTRFRHASTDLERARIPGSLSEILEDLVDQVCSEPPVSGCEVNLLKNSGEALVTAFIRLPDDFSGMQSTYQGFQYRLDHPDANVQVLKSGAPAVITEDDLGKFDDTTRMRFERWNMRGLCVLPLLVQLRNGTTRTIGTLSAFSQSQGFSPASTGRLEELCDLYAPQILTHWDFHQALERGKLVEVMYAEIQEFVADITKINSLTAIDEVFASIGHQFIDRFDFDMVNILLEENGELVMAHTSFSAPFQDVARQWEPYRKATKYSLGVRDGQSSLIFASNQRFLIHDAQNILHLPMSKKDRAGLEIINTTRTFMIVPIRLNSEVIGVMWLASLDEPVSLSESDLTLIELLASFIGTAIRNAQAHMIVEKQNNEIELLNDDLEKKIVLLDQLARKDRLTGLNNFGNFEEELKRRVSESRRVGKDSALSVILVDIDHFKPLNDTYGHPAGNQALQEVASRIMNSVRDMDFVARYGGEEFVVLLPQCDIAGAEKIAQRIRRKVAEEAVMIDGEPHWITISGGCAQLAAEESDKDLVKRVDAALYAAKNNGRNRIETAVAGD